tara:strand:+ start:784 stop:1035 length:252 start_codon:yes stop_codon:yes gene_type:complete
MTQYTEKVQEVLRRQAVEKWSQGVDYIAGQDGYIETAYKSGLVQREYHRASPCGKYTIGDKIVLTEADPMEKLLLEAPNDILL